jgi:lipopolysaccharide export system protein LptA
LLKKIIILKNPSYILTFVLLWGLCLLSPDGFAQGLPQDSIPAIADSLQHVLAPTDTLLTQDTLALSTPDTQGMDSLQLRNEKGDIETTIYYIADDSIMLDVVEKKAYLYGKAQIKYQDMQLNAEQIEIKWDQNIVMARGRTDSTGKYIGAPVWKQGADTYETDSMRYNMKTQKGIIHGIVTKQGDGFLRGDTAKRTETAIFLKNGIYTTCNLKHPHFYIRARKLKVIPDDKALSGPFHLVIEDIPTPIGFWMGFFPIMDKKKSGIIFPAFGENMNRGLYLSRGGYYWAVNDYIGMQFVGDLYANGSWLMNVNSDYIKRYKYRGDVDLGFSKIKEGFDKHVSPLTQFQLLWKHTMLAKRNGTFSANVSLRSSKYAKQNYYNPTARTQNISTSDVSYRRVFGRSPFSANVSMRVSQNNYQTTSTNDAPAKYDVTLPQASLTMNRINPFKSKYGSGNRWYDKIFVSYQGNFNYNIKNNMMIYDTLTQQMKDSTLHINESTLNRYILPQSRWAADHRVSVGSNFKMFRYLSINPSLNYTNNWHSKKYSYEYDPLRKTSVPYDTASVFRFTHHYSANIEINTRLYGTLQFKKNGLIKGIRHTAIPAMTMSFAPNFSEMKNGGWVTIPGDTNSQGEAKKYFQYSGNATPQFMQSTLNFSLNNSLEAKVRDKKDTTGVNAYKKVMLIDNISIAGNYNFAADSLKMSNVMIGARTKLFGRFDIAYSSVFDPYAWYADSSKVIAGRTYLYNHRKTNTYLFESSGKLAQLSDMNLSISTRFSPKKKPARSNPMIANPNLQQQAQLDYIQANPNMYVDFNIPWGLNLGFVYSIRKQGLEEKIENQAITATGDLSLTPQWKIVYSSGYNFKDEAITTSNFTISRDLHCWQMNMTVTIAPNTGYRTFLFTINAKSPLLQTLKMNKRSPNFIQ